MLRKQDAPLPSAQQGAASEKAGSSFGLPAATALVVGSIIGTGVFALPSALAP
jgi:APA family basic amino acid/polyamine antiporter